MVECILVLGMFENTVIKVLYPAYPESPHWDNDEGEGQGSMTCRVTKHEMSLPVQV